MIAEAIEKILSLGKTEFHDIDGVKYVDGRIERVDIPESVTLHVDTLNGLLSIATAEFLPQYANNLLIHVVGPSRVDLVTKLDPVRKSRDTLAVAVCPSRDPEFQRWRELQDMIIFLATQFVDDDNRQKLIDLIGNVRDEKITTAVDDGISQVVTVKSGVARVNQVKVDPIITLAPVRSFPEVQQATSQFLFRMRQREEGELPQCVLVECEGTGWKLESMGHIRRHVEEWADRHAVPIIV